MLTLPTLATSTNLMMASASYNVPGTAVYHLMGLTPSRQADVLDAFILHLNGSQLANDIGQHLPALRTETIDYPPIGILEKLVPHMEALQTALQQIATPEEIVPLEEDTLNHAQRSIFGSATAYTGIISGPLRALSNENPITTLFEVETEVVNPQKVSAAEDRLLEILNTIREQVVLHNLAPQSILLSSYELLIDLGFSIISEKEKADGEEAGECSHLLTENLVGGDLDCDDIGFIFLAAAHEFNWPITLGETGDHITVIWQDQNQRLIFDFGEIIQNSYAHATGRATITELSPQQVTGYFYFNRGLDYFHEEKNYKAALKDFNRAITEYGVNSYAAFTNRAAAYDELGQYQQSLVDLNEAIVRAPKIPMLYARRGDIQMNLGNFRKAAADYQASIDYSENEELDTSYESLAQAYESLAQAYYRLKEYALAVSAYNDANEYGLVDGALSYNRGIAYYKLQQYENAIKDFEMAIEQGIAEDIVEVFVYMASAHYELGNRDKIVMWLTSFMTQSPTDQATKVLDGFPELLALMASA